MARSALSESLTDLEDLTISWRERPMHEQLVELDQLADQLEQAEGVIEHRCNRSHAALKDDEDWRSELVQLIACGI